MSPQDRWGWLAGLLQRPATKYRHHSLIRSRYTRRPAVELLEERRMLAVLTVNSNQDNTTSDTDLTLREAILLVNHAGDANAALGRTLTADEEAQINLSDAFGTNDTIDFSVTGTINLMVGSSNSNRQLTIEKNLTINGPGADLLTIKAYDPTPATKNGDGSEAFLIYDGIPSSSLVSLTLYGLTISGGDYYANGSAIGNYERLTLDSCTVTNNYSGGPGPFGSGGVISSASVSTLTVISSEIRNNTNTQFPSAGSAIYNGAGSLVVTGSQIESNPRGIVSFGGNVTVTDSTFALHNSGAIIINNNGNLTVTGCTLHDNGGYQVGGAISSDSADVTIIGSTITNNSAYGGNANLGGGVYVVNGDLTVSESTISGNSASGSSAADGGGVYHQSGVLMISGSDITGNTAQADGVVVGGGVFHSGGLATIVNSWISDNNATSTGNNSNLSRGGGIYNADGNLTITSSTVQNNSVKNNALAEGGGIFNDSGDLTISGTTINNNVATWSSLSPFPTNSQAFGGGIRSVDGDVLIENATISANTAQGILFDLGGGIDSIGLTVRFSTMTANSAYSTAGGGGGISGSGTIEHTIVAGNNADTRDDLSGTFTAYYSLIGNNTGSGLDPAPVGSPDGNGNLIGTAANSIDPMLGPLADNGGPTWTHALLAGSVAINMGDPSAAAGIGDTPLYDQRGNGFVRVAEGRIDIGAVETQTGVPPLLGDYNQNSVVDAADYVLWRKMQGQTGVTPFSGADGNGDQHITGADYAVWRAELRQLDTGHR